MGGKSSQAFLGCVQDDEGDVHGQVRPVVMVFMPEELAANEDLMAQVSAETKVASRIDHVNVIGVWGVARLPEGTARVVEFADAESLFAVYERLAEQSRTLPTNIAAALCQNACMGVHYAHELGRMESGEPLIHGGIRPGTLLVSYQGMAKVTGYGAGILAEWIRKGRGEEAAVRDPYTAPEQIFGGRSAATEQTDVYALGAVMFEALTGRPPIDEDAGLADALIRDDVDPAQLGDVPDSLAQIVVHAMKRTAQDRFHSALEMRHAILDTGLCASELEVRAFMEELFPPDYPTRVARMSLLAAARKKRRDAISKKRINQSKPPSPADKTGKNERALDTDPDQAPVADHADTDSDEAVLPPPSSEHRPVDPLGGDTIPETPSHRPTAARSDSHPAAPAPTSSSGPITTSSPLPAAAPSERVVVVKQGGGILPIVLALIAGGAVMAAIVLYLQKDAPPPPAPVATPAPAPTPPPAPAPVEPEKDPDPAPSSTKKAPPPKPAKPKPATVRITTLAGVAILVDGKKIGVGDATSGELKAGKHRVALVDKSRGINLTRSVRLRSGDKKRVEFDIGRGTLILDAPPGAKVIIDGKSRGRTPLKDTSLFEGRHTVVVKNDQGAQFKRSFRVRPGDEVTMWVEFRQR